MKAKDLLMVSIIIATGFSSVACKKYLAEKPSNNIATPSSLTDCQALLDNTDNMNDNFSFLPETSSDNYFVSNENLDALGTYFTKFYLMEADLEDNSSYIQPYAKILYANTVLDALKDIPYKNSDSSQRNYLEGAACFFRAYALNRLMEVFSLPYDTSNYNNIPGVPLRMETGIDEKITRPSIQQDIQQVVTDLEKSIALLPWSTTYATSPTKTAAYAELARVYLQLANYDKALACTNSALNRKSDLIDFETLDSTADIPFGLFNKEVIFQCKSTGSSLLSPPFTLIDTLLISMYQPNDLRKTLFYTQQDGLFTLKGNYTGSNYGNMFMGISVPELYLIKAECLARMGNTSQALNTINALLYTRYRKEHFQKLNDMTSQLLIDTILGERRKELAFKGRRWSDIKRLNAMDGNKITITKKYGDQITSLSSGDLRFAFLIPSQVIEQSGITQNRR